MKNINYDSLIEVVSNCCLKETNCESCQKEKCLIGYAKKSIMYALKNNEEFIDEGLEGLPIYDVKTYDEEIALRSIGKMLKQCKNCNVYHDEDCIINIVRSALEIIIFGENHEYEGSVLMYLKSISNHDKEIALKIKEHFDAVK